MSINKLQGLVIIILIIGLGGTSLYLGIKKEKTAHVELARVFKEFELKKELEADLTKVQLSRKAVLDSLEFELTVLSKQLQENGAKDKKDINIFQLKKESYYQKKKQFDENTSALTEKYDTQIFTQMNQYVKDYGEKNGYDYIYGTDGSGVLMYANKGKDITEEVISFINEKYKGKAK